MGNVAVQHVPGITSFEDAKKQYEKITPIRGRGTRPLGRRRDHNMYSIRMGDTLSVELMCYSTPVVTFYPDGRMRLMMGGYSSITTRSFMSRVLHISSSSSGQFTKVHIGGQSYIMEPHGEYFFERNAEGKWVALNPETFTSYRINRKGANSVRKRYKQFADYLKAFIKLRGEPGDRPGVFHVGLAEYAQAFGVRKATMSTPVVHLWPNSNAGAVARGEDFIPMPGTLEILDRKGAQHEARADEFAELISSDDHEKFYKAALWLTCGHYPQNLVNDNIKHRSVWGSTMKDTFNKFVLQHHSDEAIEAYTTAVGQIPNLKYAALVRQAA
jgi:hypothetical protein